MKTLFSSLMLGAALVGVGGCAFSAPAAPALAAPATTDGAAKVHPALADFPLSKAPYLAAYRWGAANANGGAKANEAFARWINHKTVWAEDFEPADSWENNIEGGGWQLGEWQDWKKADPSRRLILSIPLLPGGWDRSGAKRGADAGKPVSFGAGAKGDYNAHFVNLAQNLVDRGLGDSVLRLGWEFNGGWYTWRASDDPKGFIEYWRQIVTAMRSVKGAEKLQFCWNPALGWQQFPAEGAYPGDEYVDIVGLDVYDESWAKDTYPIPDGATADDSAARRERAWNDFTYGGQMGLKQWSDFAKAHGKLFALPEWSISKREDGHGGLDSPAFVERMHAFITDPKNNVYFACLFDVQAGDGHHQMSTGLAGDEWNEFPQSAARFRQLFADQGAAIPGEGTGLSATFFSDPAGRSPVATAQVLAANLVQAKPAPKNISAGAARFVRLAGEIQALEGGTYFFAMPAKGAVRLWVDGRAVVDGAKGGASGPVELVAGQRYALKGEVAVAGNAPLQWNRPGKSALETVPRTQLYPAMGVGTGLKAGYFNGDNLDTLITSRTDPKVDFWWGESAPANLDGTPIKGLPADHFSVRWTGQVQALESGTYSFTTSTDDGVRLWVDGKLLVDHWVGQALTPYSAPIDLEAGRKYSIRMEYFDGTGGAVAKLSWTRPGHANAQTIPQSQLFPAS